MKFLKSLKGLTFHFDKTYLPITILFQKFVFVLAVIIASGFNLFANTDTYFMAKSDGNWSDTSIWYTNTTGGNNPADYHIPATTLPTYYNSAGIIINANVSIDVSVTIIKTKVNKGNTLTVNKGQTLSITDDESSELIVNGTIKVKGNLTALGKAKIQISGKALCSGTFSAGSSTVIYDGEAAQDIINITYNNLTLTGSNKTVPSGTIKAIGFIKNEATINMTGTEIIISSANNNINNSGSIISNGGIVRLEASGEIIHTGIIDVSNSNGNGGQVYLLAEHVGLFKNAVINADGATGGGKVRVGGGWQGGEDLPHASAVVMDSTATISTNATYSGDGGSVALWSNDYTGFYGTINAQAKGLSGDGGMIETSCKDNLQAMGNTNAGSINGNAGQWLLDPADVAITASTNQNETQLSYGYIYTWSPTASSTTAQISVTSIQTSLATNNTVVRTTNVTPQAGSAGNITVIGTPTITWSSNKTLTITSDGGMDLTGLTISNNGGASLLLACGQSFISGNMTLGTISLSNGYPNLTLANNFQTGEIAQSTGSSITCNDIFISTNGGQITLNNSNNFIALNADATNGGSCTDGANISITSTSALELMNIITGDIGNLLLTSGGDITQNSDPENSLYVGGTTNFNAGANDIILTNQPDGDNGYLGNTFGSTVMVTGNNVSLTSSDGIELGNSTITGTLSVISAANLSGGDILVANGETVTTDKIYFNTGGLTTGTALGNVVNNGTIAHSGSDATLFVYSKNVGNTLGTITGFGTIPTAIIGTLAYSDALSAAGSTTPYIYYYGTVSSTPPTVTTAAVSSISTTTATGNGNITDLGEPNPTSYGVCWNTSGTPTIEDDTTDKGLASATGVFTSAITGLSAATHYYVRAYATNSAGTGYGSQVDFYTISASPTTQACNIIWLTPSRTSISLQWTNGNGDGRVVLCKQLSAISANPLTNGTDYNADASYTGSGSSVDGGKIVFKGTGNSLTVTNLVRNRLYYFKVFEYNGSGSTIAYYQDNASGNPNSRMTSRKESVFDEPEQPEEIIAIPSNNLEILKISPNPTQDKLSIEFSYNLSKEINISIFTIAGKLVSKLDNYKLSGNVVELDLKGFGSGEYNLVISYENEIVCGSFIIRK